MALTGGLLTQPCETSEDRMHSKNHSQVDRQPSASPWRPAFALFGGGVDDLSWRNAPQ